jgi:hypothetical protein
MRELAKRAREIFGSESLSSHVHRDQLLGLPVIPNTKHSPHQNGQSIVFVSKNEQITLVLNPITLLLV